jgi:hypothetical protein
MEVVLSPLHLSANQAHQGTALSADWSKLGFYVLTNSRDLDLWGCRNFLTLKGQSDRPTGAVKSAVDPRTRMRCPSSNEIDTLESGVGLEALAIPRGPGSDQHPGAGIRQRQYRVLCISDCQGDRALQTRMSIYSSLGLPVPP